MSKSQPEVVYKRKRVQIDFDPKSELSRSRTQQHFKDECDFNKIIAKFQKTGVLNHVREYQGQYGDFSVVPSYEEAFERIKAADEMFMSLPAKLRAKFENNPGQFLAFVEDPKNAEEMKSLGLVKVTESDVKDAAASPSNSKIVSEPSSDA